LPSGVGWKVIVLVPREGGGIGERLELLDVLRENSEYISGRARRELERSKRERKERARGRKNALKLAQQRCRREMGYHQCPWALRGCRTAERHRRG